MLSFPIQHRDVLVILLAVVLLFSCSACTMTVRVSVQDENGNPVHNAVVFAAALQSGVPGTPPGTGGMDREKRNNIDLKDQHIVPLVLPVQAGTTVSFSNRAAIQHQIYSISPAKPFNLTIDKGASSAGMVFDKPGIVVVGSAINDRMIGYIYVLKTPWFATTGKDGTADLRDLPKGTYDVRVWHPAIKGSTEATAKRVAPSSQRETQVNVTITLQPALNPEPKPSPPSLPAAGGK
jgi:plastocyanin